MKTFEYTIQDEDGIHSRPAGIFVKAMKEFSSAVQVAKGEKNADGKKLFQLMKLGVKHTDTITVTADGEDEESAIKKAEQILKENL